MSHDKIKAAAKRRMAETGESYAMARRAVMQQHQEAESRVLFVEGEGASAFQAVSEQLARHAHQVMAQLAYPSGIAEIHRRFAEQAIQASGINESVRRMADQAIQAGGLVERQRRMADQVLQSGAELHQRMADLARATTVPIAAGRPAG